MACGEPGGATTASSLPRQEVAATWPWRATVGRARSSRLRITAVPAWATPRGRGGKAPGGGAEQGKRGSFSPIIGSGAFWTGGHWGVASRSGMGNPPTSRCRYCVHLSSAPPPDKLWHPQLYRHLPGAAGHTRGKGRQWPNTGMVAAACGARCCRWRSASPPWPRPPRWSRRSRCPPSARWRWRFPAVASCPQPLP